MRCWPRPGPPSGGCGRCRRGSGCTSCWRCACSPGWATARCGPNSPPRRAAGRRRRPKPFETCGAARRGADARAVRGAGRPGRRAAHPRRAVRPLRTVAFDGCVSVKVPDTDRNRSWLGKLRASLGTTGYPALRYNMFATVVVGASIRAIYLREDPTAEYIHCGFCVIYRAIDPSFLAFHMLECHELELIKAPIVSHNTIPAWYNLEEKTEYITEHIQRRNLKAGWLAVRK